VRGSGWVEEEGGVSMAAWTFSAQWNFPGRVSPGGDIPLPKRLAGNPGLASRCQKRV